MLESHGEFKTGLITYAVSDTEVNNLKIKKGNFIGLNDDSSQVAHTNKIETTKHLLQNLIDQDEDEILTTFYGEDISDGEKLEISTYVEDHCEEIEAECHEGNQPVYSLMIIAE